uniref:Uncharacterized protein n=1 Tax=Sphaerodactylus townsendi TaxID=933632 RepID=A0ACB8FCI8_9SAUR
MPQNALVHTPGSKCTAGWKPLLWEIKEFVSPGRLHYSAHFWFVFSMYRLGQGAFATLFSPAVAYCSGCPYNYRMLPGPRRKVSASRYESWPLLILWSLPQLGLC